MLNLGQIKQIAAQQGVLEIIIEKDYILDWMLLGLSQSSYFSCNLVFKGGTATCLWQAGL